MSTPPTPFPFARIPTTKSPLFEEAREGLIVGFSVLIVLVVVILCVFCWRVWCLHSRGQLQNPPQDEPEEVELDSENMALLDVRHPEPRVQGRISDDTMDRDFSVVTHNPSRSSPFRIGVTPPTPTPSLTPTTSTPTTPTSPRSMLPRPVTPSTSRLQVPMPRAMRPWMPGSFGEQLVYLSPQAAMARFESPQRASDQPERHLPSASVNGSGSDSTEPNEKKIKTKKNV